MTAQDGPALTVLHRTRVTVGSMADLARAVAMLRVYGVPDDALVEESRERTPDDNAVPLIVQWVERIDYGDDDSRPRTVDTP